MKDQFLCKDYKILEEMSLMYQDEPHVSRNILWRCKTRLEFGVWHFQSLL